MMIKLTRFQNRSQIVQSCRYELDGQEQEALISLRDARKKLQHATKSKDSTQKVESVQGAQENPSMS